ncbi:TonB-dependent siderophore receptor [Rhizobium sp. VS19-DR104.2]|uniref:TonB-dependent siderophore receptor n=1 Tax=unclassified Rhizobium TaxID=2613769 RepID=UPI001C5A8FD6|nr:MULTISPECIES: TonB-dependent siderophore receptor [unclassified Rhizobium]MBZ5762116.1 TonB-dependent siderophore receptor [Rhizobium sp. VS19-DR96]MBZ5768229.1 TonB-dependent siderophore receptor [Rhizobium sp. VS19-DR129.2]MBZ5775706.1 TonB-dependent siderophore receptor [Rhizobium sp. VS19-DRK62.2]MBZ5786993.1 TonB-dependent siderophore receptor [Rhizobium sp. VS19-DR121]MBZ5804154.1 TonB-dependent siderophore receptor [Rhizobium sp. VS19-DR181]
MTENQIGGSRLRLLCSVLLVACVGFAPLSISTNAVAESGKSYAFTISGQPLSAALVRYSSVTGIDVAFDGNLPANLRTSGISGNLPAEAALSRLLAGTGLTYRFTTPTTALLVNSKAVSPDAAADGDTSLQPIVLKGERGRGPVVGFVATQSATGTKTDAALKNTPQAINVVTRDQMTAQGSATLTQAFRYTPGVISQFGDDSRYDWFTIRGFRPGRYLDGLRLPFGARGYAQPRVEPYSLERAEVLKGPASVLYGQSEPGGLINMVSKRPSATAKNEVETQFGTDNRIQTAFDLNGNLNDDDSLLYRLVGVGRLTDTQYDFVKEKKGYIAPSFTFKPDEGTSLTIYGSYQRIDSPGGGGAPALPANGTLYTGKYPELPRSTFPGEPGYDHYKSEQASVGYELEHELDETWTVRQNLRYSYVSTDTQRVQPYCPSACNPAGFYRYAWAFPESSRAVTVDNQAVGHFSTGDLAHTALFGLDYSYESSRYEESALSPIFKLFNGFDPVYGATSVTRPAIATKINQQRSQTGLYAQDQVEWDRFVFSLGGRYDWANTDTRTRTSVSDNGINQRDGHFTWRAGLVYNFDNGISPYAGYSTSFNPASGTDRAGTAFDPTTGEQFEVGVKYQPVGRNSFVTLSAFDLTQDNVLSPDPENTSFNVQTGQVRMRGIELEGKAELTDAFSVLASYAYTDSDITKANANAAGVSNQGNRFAFVPRHQASLWLDYTLQTSTTWDGLSLGGGARYTGQTYGDNANLFDIPSYTVFDAAVRYDFGKANPKMEGLKASLNVSNLFDRKYVSTCIAATGCYWGEGRSVYATLKYSW